jgi:hypothetical protein
MPSLLRLGTLAVALGSGDLHILRVPRPSQLSGTALGTGGSLEGQPSGAGAIFVRPSLDASAQAGTMGSSLPSALEWLPSAPHDLLLVSLPLRCLCLVRCS